MKNYTLCFYENPGALLEIKQWENLKFDSIIKKEIWLDNTRVYNIKLDKEKCNGYDEEILMCIAMDDMNYGSKSCEDIVNVINNLDADYYKTIVFGKVNYKWINKINNVILELEKIKYGK